MAELCEQSEGRSPSTIPGVSDVFHTGPRGEDAMTDYANKLSENLQVLLTHADKARIEHLAENEGHSVSHMMRVLVLQNLHIWEQSAPGRYLGRDVRTKYLHASLKLPHLVT
jgi:hypothetical protein